MDLALKITNIVVAGNPPLEIVAEHLFVSHYDIVHVGHNRRREFHYYAVPFAAGDGEKYLVCESIIVARLRGQECLAENIVSKCSRRVADAPPFLGDTPQNFAVGETEFGTIRNSHGRGRDADTLKSPAKCLVFAPPSKLGIRESPRTLEIIGRYDHDFPTRGHMNHPRIMRELGAESGLIRLTLIRDYRIKVVKNDLV